MLLMVVVVMPRIRCGKKTKRLKQSLAGSSTTVILAIINIDRALTFMEQKELLYVWLGNQVAKGIESPSETEVADGEFESIPPLI